MKDLQNPVLGLVLTAFIIVMYVFVTDRKTVCEVTPRILLSDHDFYDGKTVRVRTSGMESSEGSLKFRENTGVPFSVVCKFAKRMPEKIPESVTGVCRGRVNGVVVVEECKP